MNLIKVPKKLKNTKSRRDKKALPAAVKPLSGRDEKKEVKENSVIPGAGLVWKAGQRKALRN